VGGASIAFRLVLFSRSLMGLKLDCFKQSSFWAAIRLSGSVSRLRGAENSYTFTTSICLSITCLVTRSIATSTR